MHVKLLEAIFAARDIAERYYSEREEWMPQAREQRADLETTDAAATEQIYQARQRAAELGAEIDAAIAAAS